jgi:polyisoprenoid-binding protein YceI
MTFAAVAQASLSSIGETDVKFYAKGLAGLKIAGSGTTLKASEAGGKIKVVVPLTGLDTGIDLRDEHLKKAINVGAHPNATLEVDRAALKFPKDKETLEGQAKGTLTLNGNAQPTSFTYKVKRTGSDYHVEDGTVIIDITKHGIELPCMAGACVTKDVKVTVKFKLRDK